MADTYPKNSIDDNGVKKVWDMIMDRLNLKVDKEAGKGLSTNDYTTTEKNKLAGIEDNAEVNTVTSVAGKTGDVALDKSDVGLNNVGNFKAVSTSANQGLTDTEKSNARANIDTPSNGDIQSSKTLKSSVVTVTDAYPMNAEDITVDITPQQDLHGYDKPWAGGAGKNKLKPHEVGSDSRRGVTVTYNADESMSVTATAITGSSNYLYFDIYGANTTNVSLLSPLFNGLVAGGAIDLTLEGNPAGVGLLCQFNRADGSLTTPISTYSSKITSTVPNDAVYVYVALVIKKDRVALPMDAAVRVQISNTGSLQDWTPYSNICPIEGWTSEELTQKDDATNPTVTHTYTVNFGQAVYGGKWHSKGGVDNEMAIVDFGDLTWETASTSQQGKIRFRASVNGLKQVPDTVVANILSTIYEPKNANAVYNCIQGIATSATVISVYDETKQNMTAAEFKTAMTGQKILYELATPTTINTDAVDIPMLQGINTISGSTGDVSLKYQPDNVVGELKGEIEDNIVYEDFKWTTESSQSYSAGTPGTYGTSCWRNVKKEGYDVIGVTFVENRRFGDCILTLNYIPPTNHVEVIIFRATSSSVTIADEDIVYRVAYKKA